MFAAERNAQPPAIPAFANGRRRTFPHAPAALKPLAGSLSMRYFRLSATVTIAASLMACGITCAFAIPLTPFRSEPQAQRHCRGDTVVWLDFRKGIYYVKRQRYYARGASGSFVCRDEARGGGYRRSLLGLR
jgi:hypothetical protein